MAEGCYSIVFHHMHCARGQFYDSQKLKTNVLEEFWENKEKRYKLEFCDFKNSMSLATPSTSNSLIGKLCTKKWSLSGKSARNELILIRKNHTRTAILSISSCAHMSSPVHEIILLKMKTLVQKKILNVTFNLQRNRKQKMQVHD